ncbi:Leucine efflux protein [Roseovarius albus]|uniref:Leucine efflux protein n=1 Tax=Roseovarius albus TaxID=1247867 RepID=A0A1X6YGH0_9RHOB|nr:LysE family translocator [Roseovarius albus]SLN20759.1 Leucine efflux protein [Roseovarius albus]
MTIEHLIAFNLALFAALASPGPALLVSIKTTLTTGRNAGMAIGCGLGLMAALWTLTALLGLEVVFELFPWAYVIVKTAGAIYLIYIACSMWKHARDQAESIEQPARHAFRQGIMINLLNPKSVLFAAAVLVVIFPSDMTTGQSVFVMLNHLFVEIVFYCGMALGMSTKAVSAAYLRAKVYIDRVSAGVLGLLGMKLLISR